jgi:hypothetical protein
VGLAAGNSGADEEFGPGRPESEWLLPVPAAASQIPGGCQPDPAVGRFRRLLEQLQALRNWPPLRSSTTPRHEPPVDREDHLAAVPAPGYQVHC